jgi:hypothetical protein
VTVEKRPSRPERFPEEVGRVRYHSRRWSLLRNSR